MQNMRALWGRAPQTYMSMGKTGHGRVQTWACVCEREREREGERAVRERDICRERAQLERAVRESS